ncbi:hypothetical protein AAFF_G00328900 [Aldrovandia affinis]|uniref:Uncharacterized protein n=1 Tax=Aldrovandia affinis TaxID=143900 RepID=A0AAD7WQT8_9TELE|nr:hypothetical protein AAFF_G00328900 [Aldrovandia affinis]
MMSCKQLSKMSSVQSLQLKNSVFLSSGTDMLNRGLHQKGVISPPSPEPHAQIQLRNCSLSRMSGTVCAVLLFTMAGTVSSSNDANTSNNGNDRPSHNKTNQVWWEEFLTLHTSIAFGGGAILSTIFCCVIFCVIWSCASGKQRKPKDQDTEKSGAALVTLTSVDQQWNSIVSVAEDEQTPLRASRGDKGAADGGGGGTAREVDYATIDYNHLKKRDEAEEGECSTQADYAEIRKEKKEGDFSGGETEMADEEGEGEGGMEAEHSEDLGAVGQWHTGPEENDASLYSEIKEVNDEV